MSIIEKALEKQRQLGQANHVVKASTQHSKRSVVDAARQSETPTGEPRTKKAIPTRPVERYAGEVKIESACLKSKGMLVPQESADQFNKDEYKYMRRLSEEYRLIKRPLLANAFGDSGIERANLLLVTSSLPSEGKTFTAINLALSMATERDKTVLLIDADVAKPSIAKVLELETEDVERPGLIELLESPDVKLSDVLLKTNIPGLTLLPAGKRHRHSTELLASQSMKKLLQGIAEDTSKIIIIDSPPLLAASQGAVLATLVGQVVMVVEAKKTPQHALQEAVAKLDGCEIIGCVLNKVQKGFWGNYYGYGYGYGGYGYGDYGHDNQNEPSEQQ